MSDSPTSHICRRLSARSLGIRVLTLAALHVLSSGAVARAHAGVDAPGLNYGPTVVRGGLLWSGPAGVSLSSAGGTRLLVAGAQLPEVLLQGGWIVVVKGSGQPRAGRRGGRLAAVQSLRHCVPAEEMGERRWRVAVADGNLYTIVQASCLGRPPRQGQFLVRARLGTGTVHAIGRVPNGAVSLSAAGRRLALTYEAHGPRGNRVRVDVRDSTTARLLYSVSSPNEEGAPYPYRGMQIDAQGDVLVTDHFIFLGPGDVSFTRGWWGSAKTRLGYELDQQGSAIASLSEGRIAYASDRGGVEHIDVLNLTTRKTRTPVTFPGSVRVEGVGLRSDRLAWAQQSYGYQTITGTPIGTTVQSRCVAYGPVGPTELAETTISAHRLPLVVKGISVPPAVGPTCTPPA